MCTFLYVLHNLPSETESYIPYIKITPDMDYEASKADNADFK